MIKKALWDEGALITPTQHLNSFTASTTDQGKDPGREVSEVSALGLAFGFLGFFKTMQNAQEDQVPGSLPVSVVSVDNTK